MLLQSHTDRIVFKLFGKEPGDFPIVLRAQVFLAALVWSLSTFFPIYPLIFLSDSLPLYFKFPDF